MFLRISWIIHGLFCSLVSLLVIFISGIYLSRRVWIKFRKISREVSGFSSSVFKISSQFICSSFLKAWWLNTLRFLLKRIYLLIVVVLCDLLVYIKNCARWSDIGLVRLPAIEFSSVLLSKMLSIRAFEWVVSLVGIGCSVLYFIRSILLAGAFLFLILLSVIPIISKSIFRLSKSCWKLSKW